MTNKQIQRLYRLLIGMSLILSLFLAWPNQQTQHGRLSGVIYDSLLPAPELSPDNRIVIVDIDEASLQKIGRWPWSRSTLAKLVDGIQQQKPAIIGLDILLPEPSTPEEDGPLKQQLAADNLITAITFSAPSEQSIHTHNTWPNSDLIVDLSESLYSDSTRKAHITPSYDQDGSIRRIHPIICHQQQCYKTLSLSMLESLVSMPAELSPNPSIIQNDELCVGPYCQHIDSSSYLWIPYQHSNRISYVPAWTLLEHQQIPELKGTMVLVGTSAVGLGDNVVTPLSPDTPGVNIHATALAGWFDNYSWQPLRHQSRWQSAVLLTISLLALCWPHAHRFIKAAILCVFALSAVTPYVLINNGYWVNPLPISILLLGVILARSSSYSIANISERQKLYRAFSNYVPPIILRQLVKDRDDLKILSPQRAEVTVIFADIQGFTKLCEQLPPELLVEMTNHLFTELTDEVHKHQGTLDKYMGDCLMAFWGAPLKQPNHKIQALDCALELEKRMASLAPWLAERNLPQIKLSMALETGEVTVGNLGSRQRRAYTVMGHSVNLAAHLQTMTKQLGHNILLGPKLTSTLPAHRYSILGRTEIKGISGEPVVSTPTTPVS